MVADGGLGNYVRRTSVALARRVSLAGEDLEETLAKHGEGGIHHLNQLLSTTRDTVVSVVGVGGSYSDESGSDSASGEVPSEADYKRVRRRSNGLVSLGEDSTTARRRRVIEMLGFEDPLNQRTWWQEFQRKIGVEGIKVRIAMKQLEVKEREPRSPAIYNLVKDMRFECFVAVMIVLNAISLGVDSFYKEGDEKPALLRVAESVFTVIFMLEWILRVVAFTWVWIVSSTMNLFDTFLIWVVGVGVNWVLPLMGVQAEFLQNIGCLRILRLARLCRCIRLVPFFRELWILVQGVIECSRLLFWTWIIVGSIHFAFGVACVDLVAKSERFQNENHELHEHVQYYFGSLVSAMLTLFQIMTFDSWGRIVFPIIHEEPVTFLLFGLYAGISGIVLFNMMTAIVVQNAFERVKTDLEAVDYWNREKERKVKDNLRRTFEDMDEDGSGYLTQDEFTDVLDDVEFVRKMKMLDIDLEELPDVFDILDDGDQQIDQDEFIRGLMWMQGVALNRDILKAKKTMEKYSGSMLDVEDVINESVHTDMESIADYLDSVSEDGEALSRLCGELVDRLNCCGIIRLYQATSALLPSPPQAFVDEDEFLNAQLERKARSGKAKGKATMWSAAQDSGQEDLLPVPLRLLEDWSKKSGYEPVRKQLSYRDAGTSKLGFNEKEAIVEVLDGYQDNWSAMDLKLRTYADAGKAKHFPCIAALPPTLAGLPPQKRASKASPAPRNVSVVEPPTLAPPELQPPAPSQAIEANPPLPTAASMPQMSVQQSRNRRQSLKPGTLPPVERRDSVTLSAAFEAAQEPALQGLVSVSMEDAAGQRDGSKPRRTSKTLAAIAQATRNSGGFATDAAQPSASKHGSSDLQLPNSVPAETTV